MDRGSGLLVHISELPSKYGIGTFGAEARRFVRFLASSKQKYWQILPLNPTGFRDSPYQSCSAFALNPYFIDLSVLKKKGYLTKEELKGIRKKRTSAIDYGNLYSERYPLLYLAYSRAYIQEKDRVQRFYASQKKWLDDYAMFMTFKDLFGGLPFYEWPKEYRNHRRSSIEKAKEEHRDRYCFYVWLQYEAYMQYKKLRKYAHRKGIRIIGDMPIYVAMDSADVWGNAKMFQLDSSRRPVKVAGVPPDCFSQTGQLWGNPLYDYDYMKKTGYRWWKRRFRAMSKLYDCLRVDHFRGFDEYWAIPSGDETALNGSWMPGPGYDLFVACENELKKISIIAEDLGIITDSVKTLRRKCGFPGLKIYQFAFDDYESHLKGEYGSDYASYRERIEKQYGDAESAKYGRLCNAYLPHNYETNCVAYIGTHDNDILDHHLAENPHLIPLMKDYLKIDRDEDIHDTLIGSLMRSAADVVIFLPQDLLRMGEESRINIPGKADGNWRFRFGKKDLSPELAEHLRIMTEEACRA